jgi:ring-1,2-phenylacetyl-CoA epoxidase subunit PaaC
VSVVNTTTGVTSASGLEPQGVRSPGSHESASNEALRTGALGNGSLLSYLLRLGDTSLVLGQRLGEWIGHSPALEEDLGLANLALDLVGQARLLLTYAAEVEGRGRDEDALAFFRDAPQFMNLTLAEQPNGDFAQTMARQVLLDAWQLEMYEGLSSSTNPRLAAIAAKALKESRYHYRFSTGWLIRLGDGTPESHRRAQSAVNGLWRFTDELFAADAVDEQMVAEGIAPRLSELQPRWSARIDEVLREATLERPARARYPWHGKRGVHTEHLGHMLTEMQHLQRTYPGAQW